MKNLLSTLALIILASTMVHAQDILFLRSGSTMKVQVVQLSKNKIRYYDWGSKRERVYVIATADVVSIKYANGTIKTFDLVKTQKSKIDSFGRNTKSWTINAGGGILFSTPSISLWKGGLGLGLSHQYGYQITNNANISIGGEFMYFTSSTDTTANKEKSGNTSYRISYLGIPLTLNLVELGKPGGLYFSTGASVGVRYCNQIISSNLGLGFKVSFSGGIGVKTGKTYLQIGAYADYVGLGNNYNGLGYGLRVTTIR